MIDTPALEELCAPFAPTRGAPARHSLSEFFELCVYHQLAPDGTRAAHAFDVGGIEISDSAISQRLQGLDPRLFQTILDRVLQPLADRRRHPEAFYQHWRLIGIDGSQFSVPNGPGVAAALPKARTRRGKAAFSKLGLCALYELGLHNPIAVAIAQRGESEGALAAWLVKYLPPDALVLGDRYYGNGRCISGWIGLCQRRHSGFLFRVKENLKRHVLERFADGSALVEIECSDGRLLQVREITGSIRGRDGQKVRIRLWTSLVEARAHPANRLLKLYRQRWEEEMAIGELKQTLHGGALLRSQKVRTAWQEVAALVVAQSLVARMRVAVGKRAKKPVLRVSFEKTLEAARALCLVLVEAGDLLSARQMQLFSSRLMDRVARQLSGRRRGRSCPRAVRQPIGPWPRKQRSVNSYGDFEYEVTPIKK
jgi:hypothetical protein